MSVNNQHLWVSDGTSAGTYEIDINPAADSYPTNFLPMGDMVFFTAIVNTLGREHYIFDAVVNTVQPTRQNISIYGKAFTIQGPHILYKHNAG